MSNKNEPKMNEGGICRKILEKPAYSLGISLYRLGVRIASVFNHKAKLLNNGQKGTFKKLRENIKKGDRYVWVHAASLGEFEQGRPVIERIRAQYPQFKILLTFFSPSGFEVRKNYSGADCICYLPFDTPLRVRRFLSIVKPEVAIFVKYEFWRNYLAALNKRGIPTFLISAAFRPDQKFFKSSTSWYSRWLNWFTHIYVQDQRSRELLESIGYDRVSVCGDTRFDRVAEIRQMQKEIPLLEKFTGKNSRNEELNLPGRPLTVMVGSSWEADEKVYSDWFNKHPKVKLVIAPHEFNEARLEKLKNTFKNGAVLMSEANHNPDSILGKQVLIIDCFGLLSSAYAYCDIAYVGGAFGAGLHNINEAAVYDVPVIYGPNNKKFIEASEMAESGGGNPISSKSEFNKLMDTLYADREILRTKGEAAGAYIRSKIGASDKILSSPPFAAPLS